MRDNRLVLIWFCVFLLFSKSTFAQSETNDRCLLYNKILQYLNKKEANIKYEYEGSVNPENGSIGKRVKRKGRYYLSFYIVKSIDMDFEYLSVKDWFSKLVQDNTIIQKSYRSSGDSVITCSFDDRLKYQYKEFDEIKFSPKDFLETKCKNVHYTPIRILFSKILFTEDKRALVFAKIYQGMGSGNDQWIYCFVFKKINDDWNISIVKGEIR